MSTHAHTWPATHIAVARAGCDVISTFVFDDGLSEPRGVAVVMAPAAVLSAVKMFEDLQRRSSALQQVELSALLPPPRYIPEQIPCHAHTVDAVTAEDSGTIVLCFRPVDYEATISGSADDGLTIATMAGVLVAMSGGKFRAWALALSETSS